MKSKEQKPKVLLAMSGGVDSSVAALLLQKQGYEVIGAFMKNWSDTKDPLTGRCAWRTERKMALKIASQLGISLITLDFEKQYREKVIDKMFEKYKRGITPNPDIDCNQKIKAPRVGLEPTTSRLTVVRSTNWAIRACIIFIQELKIKTLFKVCHIKKPYNTSSLN